MMYDLNSHTAIADVAQPKISNTVRSNAVNLIYFGKSKPKTAKDRLETSMPGPWKTFCLQNKLQINELQEFNLLV